jgi:hypothetical protein
MRWKTRKREEKTFAFVGLVLIVGVETITNVFISQVRNFSLLFLASLAWLGMAVYIIHIS